MDPHSEEEWKNKTRSVCFVKSLHTLKTITFIRHGEASSNKDAREHGDHVKLYEEHFDANLTEHGRSQSITLVSRTKSLPIELVVVSPLTRAITTGILALEDFLPPKTNWIVKEEVYSCHIF